MKKLVFLAFACLSLTFVACGQKQVAEAESVDTTLVDTLAVDTIVADTVVAE